MKYILVIMLSGGYQTGIAVDHIELSDKLTCSAAQIILESKHVEAGVFGKIATACVPKGQE